MSYTEIPTDLLVEVAEYFDWLKDEVDNLDDSGTIVVKNGREQLESMQPLVKWLEYIRATWAADAEFEEALAHRYCAATDMD